MLNKQACSSLQFLFVYFMRLKKYFFVICLSFVTAITTQDVAIAADKKPYTVNANGEFDWYTFNGYRRYHAECHVCHGPAGIGSSFAPNLTESVKVLGYDGFLEVVVNGRQIVNNTSNQSMPSFANNMNVMCYIDDIYSYLLARGDGVLGTNRPKKEAKPQAAKDRDDACSP